MKDEDFLRYVLGLVMRAAPTFSEAQAEQVERQIRHEWGGGRPFIAKDKPRCHHAAARVKVIAEVGTKPDRQLASEAGISRRTLYRYLAKGGK